MANTPLRLHKSWVHEGGISTPLIVHWPKGIAARGEVRRSSGHLIDLAPTLIELAGGKAPEDGAQAPPRPGKSLVPAFARDATIARDYLWWYHDGNRALRVGDWKLVADHDKPWELYDLKADRSETHDLAAQHADQTAELERRWKMISESFRDAAAGPVPETPKRKKRKERSSGE